jgi:hypothetical protein
MGFIPTIKIGTGWPARQDGRSHRKNTSLPPNDLREHWDPQWGYSKSYYRFIYTFVAHYSDDLKAIIIENEMNAPRFWAGTKEEYVRVLKTAYLAAHRAKPGIIVMDGGIASGALGPVMIREMIASRPSEPEAVLAYANQFFAKTKSRRFRWNSLGELRKWANREFLNVQHDRINYYLANSAGARDWLAIHYYEDVRFLDDVVRWIRSKLSEEERSIPIAITEYGIRNLDPEYDPGGVDQASEVCKKLVTGLSLEMKLMVWYSLKEDALDKVGLLNGDGSWRPAARAFEFLAGKIGRELQFAEASEEGISPRRFVFTHRLNPSRKLEVLWSEEAPVRVALEGNLLPGGAAAYSVVGEPMVLRERDGVYSIEVTSVPVYLEYGGGADGAQKER